MFDRANQTATEAFASIRTVAAFSLARPLCDLYRNLLVAPSRMSARRAHTSGIGFGYSQFVIFALYALAFWYGGKLVAEGTMELDNLLKVQCVMPSHDSCNSRCHSLRLSHVLLALQCACLLQ